jgi:hypothetical protein
VGLETAVIWTGREELIAVIRQTEHPAPDLMVRLRTIIGVQKSGRKFPVNESSGRSRDDPHALAYKARQEGKKNLLTSDHFPRIGLHHH